LSNISWLSIVFSSFLLLTLRFLELYKKAGFHLSMTFRRAMAEMFLTAGEIMQQNEKKHFLLPFLTVSRLDGVGDCVSHCLTEKVAFHYSAGGRLPFTVLLVPIMGKYVTLFPHCHVKTHTQISLEYGTGHQNPIYFSYVRVCVCACM
jgi:hypothetical protein